MNKPFKRGVWWVKRDFRLYDNDALYRAIEDCEAVLPLFIIEPSLCSTAETSYFHYHAWQQAGDALNKSLRQRGSSLQLWVGEVCEVLELIQTTDSFDALYSHEETGSDITYQRDQKVGLWTQYHKIPWIEAHQNGVIRGLKDRSKRSPVIRQRLVLTPSKPAPLSVRTWSSSTTEIETLQLDNTRKSIVGKAQRVKQWPAFEWLTNTETPNCAQQASKSGELLQPVTENHAQDDLHSFLHVRGIRYSGGISSPNTAFTAGSRLSAHLAWGTISLRHVFQALTERDRELATLKDAQSRRWRKSLRAFQSRLHWHDHFMQRLESAPTMEFQTINPAYHNIRYGDNDVLQLAWQTGRTGLPIVDACVRCLAATGFLNFRMRALLVSVACFGMAQSWQSLQYPLARLFRDYEPGIHLSQIQMQAGVVGINTLRIYNPHKQLIDHDSQALFVKRWIPELREFDAVQIARYQEQSLGEYPQPITDFDANTRAIRDQIYAIRKSLEGKNAARQILKDHGSRLPGNDRARAAQRRRNAEAREADDKGKNGQLSLDFDQ